MSMTESDALALLGLDPEATDKHIRSRLFQEYQRLTAVLSQLSDERQRPLLETELERLNEARDLLMAADRRGDDSPIHPTLLSQEEFPDQIAVLLYQQGRQEGIYTQRIQDHDLILGFLADFGARKYAQQLVKRGMPKARVEWFDTSEIVEFCQGNGYGLVIIPADETLQPPEAITTTIDDWESH